MICRSAAEGVVEEGILVVVSIVALIGMNTCYAVNCLEVMI